MGVKITNANTGASYAGSKYIFNGHFLNVYNGNDLVKSWAADNLNDYIIEDTADNVKTLTGVTLSKEAAVVGDEITATPVYVGTSSAAVTVAYAWYRANASTGDGTAIDGATAAKYTAVEADEDKYLYCKAVASGGATGMAESAHIAVTAAEEG